MGLTWQRRPIAMPGHIMQPDVALECAHGQLVSGKQTCNVYGVQLAVSHEKSDGGMICSSASGLHI